MDDSCHKDRSKRFIVFPSLSFIYGSIYITILLTGGAFSVSMKSVVTVL